MRITVLLGMLLLVLLPNLSFAEKITYDPNLVKPTSAKSTSDERLEQKITYTAKNKRLHTVLEEISEQTGVVIRSGTNEKDWQVRDLPIFVCVKDMPLGDLLDHITRVTHLLLSSTMVGDKPQYRIWLDAARRKQIEECLARMKDMALAEEKWKWDAWVRCGSIPADELNKSIEREVDEDGGTTYPDEQTIDSASRFPAILAELPAETKDAVFAGEVIRINAKDASASLREKITSLYRSQWEYQQQEQERYALENPEVARYFKKREFKESYLESTSLVISLSSDRAPSVNARVDGGQVESFYFPFWMLDEIKHPAVSAMLDEHYKSIEEQLAQQQHLLETLSFECPDGFTRIDDYESEDKSVNIKIQKPAKSEELRYSDIMELISKASGCSIITEDFKSKRPSFVDDETFYGHEISLKQALQNSGQYDYQWYGNDKVVLGSENSWYDSHKNLMPEQLLSELSKKLNTTGVDLDDIVPLVNFTEEQISEWVASDRELRCISLSMMGDDRMFWRLYDALSPSDKTAAKSENGVPIAKINPNLASEVFAKAAYEKHRTYQESGDLIGFGKAMMSDPEAVKKITEWVMQQHPELSPHNSVEETGDEDLVPDFDTYQLISEIKQQFPEYFAPVLVPTDPYQISKLRLQVLSNDYPNICMEEPDAKMPEVEKRHSYRMEISGDGTKISVLAPCYSFPIYSEKRLQQLYKEQGIITEDESDDSSQK